MNAKDVADLKRLRTYCHDSQIRLNTARDCGKRIVGIHDIVQILAALEIMTHIIERREG